MLRLRCAWLFVASACLVPLAPGCGGDDDDDPMPMVDASVDAPAISAECLEATMHQDYAWISENILKKSCGNFDACHAGATPKRGLNLDTGAFDGVYAADPARPHANLVNVDAVDAPGMKLVEPGSPENSYLMITLGRYDQTKLNSSLMPRGQAGAFCDEKKDAIERWIAAGATM